MTMFLYSFTLGLRVKLYSPCIEGIVFFSIERSIVTLFNYIYTNFTSVVFEVISFFLNPRSSLQSFLFHLFSRPSL